MKGPEHGDAWTEGDIQPLEAGPVLGKPVAPECGVERPGRALNPAKSPHGVSPPAVVRFSFLD